MKFKLGSTCLTAIVQRTMFESSTFTKEVFCAFARYVNGDWGDLCNDDKAENENAIARGGRIFAKYNTSETAIYIITEYDRSSTTILFTDEY